MSFQENLQKVVARQQELSNLMTDPEIAGTKTFVQLSKEYAQLAPIVDAINEWKKTQDELENLIKIIDEPFDDQELKKLILDEINIIKDLMPTLEQRVKLMFLPTDEADSKNAILEVRAGTGGNEAALFASDIFRMYQRYADTRGWKFEVIHKQEIGIGGFKEAMALFSGQGVFARLKFESGVHRVQRVPTTESSGRIHTSAATVAVMPEAESFDIELNENDLRIDTFRAQGAGGQHVNTTDSAVRITHIPSGLVVSQQDEKSQHKNKAKALKILRARLYDAERNEREAERAQKRKEQVGSGDRSERIRTYNFPDRRVTDHRIGLTLHNLEGVLQGKLDEIIDVLIAEDEASKLADFE